MTYKWYNLFNLDDWLETGLVSRTLSVVLDEIGPKEILLTQGNETGLVIDDTFLAVEMGGDNPFWRDGWGVFIDEDSNIWLGKEEA